MFAIKAFSVDLALQFAVISTNSSRHCLSIEIASLICEETSQQSPYLCNQALMLAPDAITTQ